MAPGSQTPPPTPDGAYGKGPRRTGVGVIKLRAERKAVGMSYFVNEVFPTSGRPKGRPSKHSRTIARWPRTVRGAD